MACEENWGLAIGDERALTAAVSYGCQTKAVNAQKFANLLCERTGDKWSANKERKKGHRSE